MHGTTCFIKKPRHLFRVVSRLIFNPLVSTGIRVVNASFDLTQDLACPMVRMIFLIDGQTVAKFHLFFQANPMTLHVGLDGANFTNLLIRFIKQPIKGRQVTRWLHLGNDVGGVLNLQT